MCVFYRSILLCYQMFLKKFFLVGHRMKPNLQKIASSKSSHDFGTTFPYYFKASGTVDVTPM